jgi:hypothetical protein
MNMFKKYLFGAPCVLMLATALALSSAYAEVPVPPTVFDVNVINFPSVNVINKLDNPVPVGDVQNPAFQPFQVDARFSLRRGEGSAEAVLPPQGDAGQRVVIEHVTVAATVPEGQRIVAYIKLGEIEHALVLTSQGNWGNSVRFRASQPIRLYSLGGGDGMAFAGVERSASAGSMHVYFTVSGHLVDVDDLP